jgi:hypothetical protein
MNTLPQTEIDDLDFAELTGYQGEPPTFTDVEISELHKPENNRSTSTLTNNPYSKMALVGGVGFLGFGLAGFALTSLLSAPSANNKPVVVADNQKNILIPNVPDQKDVELQRFKTDLALGNQIKPNLPLSSDTSNNLVPNKPLGLTPNSKKSPTLPTASQKISSPPLATLPQAPLTPPQSLPLRAFNTPISSVRTLPPLSNSLPSRLDTSIVPVVVTPQEQWQALAGLGSYGTVPSETAKSNPVISQNPIPTQTSNLTPVSSGISTPTRPNLSQNPFAIANRPTVAQNPFAIANRPTQNTTTPISQPQNLVQASTVVNTPTNFLNRQSPKLLIGTTASASLKTPVVFSTLVSGSPKFIAVLDEPLLATDNSVVIPAGATLILTGQLLDPKSGLAELTVVSISIDAVETTPPAGAIVIRGSEGSPLIADNITDSGQSLGADVSSFLLSGITEAARVANNPTSSSFSSSVGGFSSSTVTPAPDTASAALFGGFNYLTKALTQRNEDARRSAISRPPIYYVPSGKRVQVFVNQTINL